MKIKTTHRLTKENYEKFKKIVPPLLSIAQYLDLIIAAVVEENERVNGKIIIEPKSVSGRGLSRPLDQEENNDG